MPGRGGGARGQACFEKWSATAATRSSLDDASPPTFCAAQQVGRGSSGPMGTIEDKAGKPWWAGRAPRGPAGIAGRWQFKWVEGACACQVKYLIVLEKRGCLQLAKVDALRAPRSARALNKPDRGRALGEQEAKSLTGTSIWKKRECGAEGRVG